MKSTFWMTAQEAEDEIKRRSVLRCEATYPAPPQPRPDMDLQDLPKNTEAQGTRELSQG